MPKQPTEQQVWINGKLWIAAEPLRYVLRPSAPVALMVGQNTHADTQDLLEHAVDLRGPMGQYEQKLGEAAGGFWLSTAGVMINDGEVTLGPEVGATTPSGMSTSTEAGCSFCVSDIDGTLKLYVVYGTRMFKTDGTTWSQVGSEVSGAKGCALIDTRVGSYRRALLWACGPDADMRVSYDGAALSAPWTGERADLVFDMPWVAYGSANVTHCPVRLFKGRLAALSIWAFTEDTDDASRWEHPDPLLYLEKLTGWTGIRHIGDLNTVDPFAGGGGRVSYGFGELALLAGRGVLGVALRGVSEANSSFLSGHQLSSTWFPETEALGDIIAGCNFLDRIALTNGKPPIYLWSPNNQPVPIGPCGADGIPSAWAGMVIRHLMADGQYLLALVELTGGMYVWRYDSQSKIWDIPPPAVAGVYAGGATPMAMLRGGLAGGTAPGGEIVMRATGTGAYDAWLRVPAIDKWLTVSEDDPNLNESYIYRTSGPGETKQLFTATDVTIPAGHSPIGLRVEAWVRGLASLGYAGQYLKFLIRGGATATDAYSPNFTDLVRPQTVWGGIYAGSQDTLMDGNLGYRRIEYTFWLDPQGAAWTQDTINSVQIGVSATGEGAAPRVTWLRAYCIYAGTPSAATMVNRLWYHAGGASPKLAYITLPADGGWNLRGSGLNYCTGNGLSTYLTTKRMAFNRPERQRVFYGIRFHGEFSASQHLYALMVVVDGNIVLRDGNITADGQFLRLPNTAGAGSVGRVIQIVVPLYGGNGATSPVLAHKGMVVEYNEIPDKRLAVGVVLDLARTGAKREPVVTPETLVEELEALFTQGTLFAVKWADRPSRLMTVSPETASQPMEELFKLASGQVKLVLVEPVPTP